jgi:hypothetical protein
VGAYAYYDTMQVAKTAIDLFAHNVVIDNGDVIDVTAITL